MDGHYASRNTEEPFVSPPSTSLRPS